MEIRQFIFEPNDCSVIKVSERNVTLFVDESVPVEVLESLYRKICARERRWIAYRRRLMRQERRRALCRISPKRRRSKIRRYKRISLRFRCRLPVR
jgi:hypothetical protein